MNTTLNKTMIPKGIAIDENMLPYKTNREYGWGKQFNAFVTDGGTHYHRSRCLKIKNSKRNVLHLYNAIEKYEPCSHCKPQAYVDNWYKDFINANHQNSLYENNEIHLEQAPIEVFEKPSFIDKLLTKTYVKFSIVVIFILSILLMITYTKFSNANQKLAQIEADFETQSESMVELNETIGTMEKNIKEKDDELDELRTLEATAELNKWEAKANFVDNYIAIVTKTGKCYHRFGCPHASSGSFWAYNVNAAKARGYSACSDCDPPNGD